MKNAITLSFTVAMLVAPAFGATVVSRAGQPWESSLPAVTESGDSFVLTREVNIEFDTPGRPWKGKGRLFLLFDRSTGYYLPWVYPGGTREYTGTSFTDQFKAGPIGVTSKGIFAFSFSPLEVEVYRFSEKAESLDDAELKTLRWAAEHMRELDLRKNRCDRLQLGLRGMTLGEQLSPPAPKRMEFVAEALLSIKWHEGEWELTFEGYQRLDARHTPEKEDRKSVKARLALNSGWYTCLDDKSEETACP